MSAWPLTLRRDALVEADACAPALSAFDALAPDGVLVVADQPAWLALIASHPEGWAWHNWLVVADLVAPLVVSAGHDGHATAGDHGHATAGDGGTATAGDGGTATAGYGGTATAGYGGTATAGYGGHATAGYGGAMVVRWHDDTRWRSAVAEVDGVAYLPGVAYHVVGGRLVAVGGAL